MVTVKLVRHTENTNGWIHVSFYLKREKVHFSTKVQCEQKHWNEKTMRVRSSDPQANDKNLILDNILSRINSVMVKFRLKDKMPGREAFLRAYNRPDDYDTFFQFAEAYQKKFARTLELSTLNNHKTALSKLKDFAPNLHFDDITEDFMVDFFCYLKKELHNNNNTAYKNIASIQKYIHTAVREGYLDSDPLDGFKVTRTQSKYVYLEEHELLELINVYHTGDLSIQKYKTLQLFLFMCFGSQHVSDAKSMQLEQFNDTSFTYYRVKLKNRKPEPIIVPISEPLRKLIREIAGFRKVGPLFEKLPADQTMNRYLKEIAQEAGINKDISHKTGRHTFATYFLSKTKDLNTLKNIMGHSSIRETLIYAHVLDKDKQEGIMCFDSFAI